MSIPKISIILPTYNEAGNIKRAVDRTAEALKNDFEIIVVDDNSPDGTADIVEGLQKDRKYLKLVVRKDERGLPSAIKKGIDEAKSDNVSWLDCDSMPPEILPEMLERLNNCDVVVGSYFIPGGKDARSSAAGIIFSKVINKLAQLVLGSEVTDYTSGFIVAKKKALSKAKFEGTHGTYFIQMLYSAKKQGNKITEIPYTLTPREYGQSKITGFWPYTKTGLAYLRAVFQARFEN
jgi:dolichol-phosphate mannosyltransferase